jgi:SAM-dependent methyltransferase
MSLRSPDRHPVAPRRQAQPRGHRSSGRAGDGLARSIRLFRQFLLEQSEPEVFYSALARDSADQLARYTELDGATIADVGGGAGLFTAEFRARGAESYLFEIDQAEMRRHGEPVAGAVLADGYWLPLADGSADICFSSNVLEHVADPVGLIDEMIRVTKPGGTIYLSFTNWYSPWGGHELSPWHLLGADFAARRYLRRRGRQPKHRVGVNLFRQHVGATLRLIKARNDVQLVDALPRYYPRYCRVVLRIPVLRELLTWNLLLVMRRNA